MRGFSNAEACWFNQDHLKAKGCDIAVQMKTVSELRSMTCRMCAVVCHAAVL